MSEPEPGPPGGNAPDDGRPAAGDRPGRVVVTRRRAPRYRAFGVTGGLAGVVVGLVLGLVPEPAGDYTRQAIAGYFVTALGLTGALLGLGLALLLERRQR